MIIWLTGRPCSGKTTLAIKVSKDLKIKNIRLDGDELRQNFWPELGYSVEDREKNVKRIATLAKDLVKIVDVVIIAAVAPIRSVRQRVFAELAQDGAFIEVYVDAPYSVCLGRDVKGMYAKALNGDIVDFTGVGSDYQPPLSPDVVCFTDDETVEESAEKIIRAIHNKRSSR